MLDFGFKTEGRAVVHEFADRVKGRTCENTSSVKDIWNKALTNRVLVLITGPSPGSLGAETAISLAAEAPATIILVGRSMEKCQPTIDAVKEINPSITIKFVSADLESLKSIRDAAQRILDDAEIQQIDVMINNAGVMVCPYKKTEDGFERQFAANYVGHWVLTNRLVPKLLAAAPGARVVNVASVANKYAGIQWDDVNFERQEYVPFKAYGQSKTAATLFAVALNRRLAARGLRAYTLNPGSIATNLQGYMTEEMAEEATQVMLGMSLAEVRAGAAPVKTLQQGCATQLRAALDPGLEMQDGVYLNDCVLTDAPLWVAPYALDKADAERLWAMTEKMVGEKFEY